MISVSINILNEKNCDGLKKSLKYVISLYKTCQLNFKTCNGQFPYNNAINFLILKALSKINTTRIILIALK